MDRHIVGCWSLMGFVDSWKNVDQDRPDSLSTVLEQMYVVTVHLYRNNCPLS